VALESVAADLRFLCFQAPGSFQPGTSERWFGSRSRSSWFLSLLVRSRRASFQVVYWWISRVCMAIIAVVGF
jgi:hypothetical protein